MVFKRRDKRSWWQIVAEAMWPRGGWGRAAQYVRHRLRRLPDKPERIARGLFAGVFTTFTPFYGMHFLVAALIAKLMRGNILAALLGTFFGNPLTYVPIGVASLQTGHFLLGTRGRAPDGEEGKRNLIENFYNAFHELWHNLLSVFTGRRPHWDGLAQFWDEVFFPYMIGGIIPGLIAGMAAYYISFPLITAYQNRRKGMIKAKLAEIRRKAAKKPNTVE